MADQFPTDPRPQHVEFVPIANTLGFQSPLNRSTQTLELPGNLWSVTLAFDAFTSRSREGLALRAFLAGLAGRAGRFELWDHTHEMPAGAYSSALDTPVVDGDSQTGKALLTRGWRNGGSDLLWKGDYLEYTAGGRKWLHMVADDVDSDGSGDASIAITPAITASPDDGAAINLVRASTVFMLEADDAARWSSRTSVSGFTISAIEAFE